MQHTVPSRKFRPLNLGNLIATVVVVSMMFFSGCQPAPPQSRAELLDMAEEHLRAGEFHKALNELNILLSQDPKNLEVHRNLAWVYLYTDNLDAALAQLHIAEDGGSTPESLYYLRGAVYAHLEKWVDALEQYNLALRTQYNNPQLHADIAQAFLHLNEPEAALREATLAFKLNPHNSLYPYLRCKAYLQLDQYTQALNACEVALQLGKTPEEDAPIQALVENIKLLQSLEAPTQTTPR